MKTAIVTGGGHGIGRAICRRLHKDGLTVVVADLEQEAAQAVAADISGHAFAVDVSWRKATCRGVRTNGLAKSTGVCCAHTKAAVRPSRDVVAIAR